MLNCASIFVLEDKLKEAKIDPSPLWLRADEWPDFGYILTDWIDETARNMAIGIVAIAAIMDMDAIFIDGGFPVSVRTRLVEAVKLEIRKLDLQGIREPKVVEAFIGSEAPVIGGASLPIFDRFMIDQNVLVREPI